MVSNWNKINTQNLKKIWIENPFLGRNQSRLTRNVLKKKTVNLWWQNYVVNCVEKPEDEIQNYIND